MPLQL